MNLNVFFPIVNVCKHLGTRVYHKFLDHYCCKSSKNKYEYKKRNGIVES